MNLRKLGIFGLISLLSYTAMVVFSPLAYPEYDWMSMAVSDLTAEGAPSLQLATRLNALFGPCSVVSIMAVCVAIAGSKSKMFKSGVYSFAGMEWICNVGYTMFPWVADALNFSPQNICHLIVTILVVVLSLAALIMIFISAKHEGLKSLGMWAMVCLGAMVLGPIGTGLLPKAVFGIFERLSTFSAVIFNAVLGVYLLAGKFDRGGKYD